MDRRAFQHYLTEDRSFSDQFLSKNVLFNLFLPSNVFRDLYLTYINQLPLYNPPNILGLHSNVEINYLTKTAYEIWSTMLDMQPEQQVTEENFNRERE